MKNIIYQLVLGFSLCSLVGKGNYEATHTNNFISNTSETSLSGDYKNVEYDLCYNASDDFKIYYNSQYTNNEKVSEIADYLNDTKNSFASLGFKKNLNVEKNKKIDIYLNPFLKDGNSGGVTVSSGYYFTNKSYNTITFYGYDCLSESLKETIVHEYFHTITNNYNTLINDDLTWFKEAIATWATFKILNLPVSSIIYLQNYIIEECVKTFGQAGYSDAMFIFTLEKEFGFDFIIDLLNAIETKDINLSASDFKNVLNSLIKEKYNSNLNYDSIIALTNTYIISFDYNYSGLFNFSISNDDFDGLKHYRVLDQNIYGYGLETTSYASSYYKVELDENISPHDIKLYIGFENENSLVTVYTIDYNNNQRTYLFDVNDEFRYEYVLSKFNSYIKKAYVVVTNVSSKIEKSSVFNGLYNHNYSDHHCTLCEEYTSNHTYTNSYEYSNVTTHYSYCGCGEKILEPHVIMNFSSAIKYCYYCGARVTIGVRPEM